MDFVGQFDYLHLGVLYLETNQLERAIETFNKQSISYELAENQYYLALTYLQLKDNDKYISCLLEAKALYLKGSKVMDVYDNPMDKIYLTDIENKL
ncbi:hypothetical protein [Flavobacterium piscinae]|uniref:hypothetical protein n=1 Tax=Flavobacterium piscinae TaxID=2506424 RepID=UPI002AAAAC03|nr:hypothetical protein [Flavobacterium piscinae]